MQVSGNFQAQQALSSSLSSQASSSRGSIEESSSRSHSRDVDRLEHSHNHRYRGRRGDSLGAFRQELRSSIKTYFKANVSTSQNAYSQAATTPKEVADEAVSAAKRLVNQSPGDAAKSLVSFRAKVQQSASVVREAAPSQVEQQDVDSAVAKIDKGLANLEAASASNQTAKSSVLEVDTKTKQRSFIKIRTQEGDVVKLSLKRVDKMSATDVAETSGTSSKATTEVSVSSRSRMVFKVDGDLNEAEMEAIKGVFAQAEDIANKFFGGDMQAAFGAAQGFEFDAEQLSRVNMRFRMRQVSSASYVERTQAAPPAVASGAPAASQEPAAVVDGTPKLSPATPEPAAVATPPKSDPVAPPPAPAIEEPAAAEPEAAAVPSSQGLASLWNVLSGFLQSSNEGFSNEASNTSIKFHYSQEFKLELLKSVVNTVAEEGLSDSVSEQIDSFLSVDQEAA